MNPTLQPRIFTFYFFSLYFHDPPDPPDLPTYLVFFPARLARARMDGRAGASSLQTCRREGVKGALGPLGHLAKVRSVCTRKDHDNR